MPRIIMKSPYIKPNSKTHIGNYVSYIATRDGVEQADSTQKFMEATEKQKQIIKKLISDYPDSKDLYEYQDYLDKPNRGNADELILRIAEAHAELFGDREKYISYIAQRPRVEKISSHGLFTDDGVPIVLSNVQKEIAESKSNVWTHIISLKREDAERLGYNNAKAWMNLIRSQRNMIAENMKIAPENFRWYAAFHNEGHHPHIHMIAYSTKPNEAYLTEKGIENIKSNLAKINSAEDNPAGMAISNKMKAQIEALDQAKSNSSDAQNVMKIADGALGEVSSMLQRIRELAVQGASDTYSENDKKALQSEIDELTKEVDRISGDTEYNTKLLLDGSSDTRVYVRQKDANGNMTQVNSYITRINFSDNVASDKYELTVNSLATQATGSLASATKPDAEGTISINGVSVAVKADMTQDEYIQALQKAATTAGTTMQVNGDSISFLSNEYGSDSTVNISLSSSLKALAGAGYENADDGSGNMQLKSNGKDAVVTGGENLSDKTIRADGNRVYVVGNSGFSMDFLLSSDMDMTAGSSNLQIDISDIGNMAVQIGANEGQEMKIRIPEVSSQTLYLDTVDVTVKGGADKAMSTLDEAIEYVSGVRSRIGAFQNRLESAESSLSETSENMTGAYSNIMDTDMATEMTEYAAQNILDQAGISVLSQANDLPQQVLSLLSS